VFASSILRFARQGRKTALKVTLRLDFAWR